jgi:hypothetical protein
MKLVKIAEVRNPHTGEAYYENDHDFHVQLEALRNASNILRFHFLTTGCSEWAAPVNFNLGQGDCCGRRKLSDVYLVEGFKVAE